MVVKIRHNNAIGYRDTYEEAEKTIRERLAASHSGRSYLLTSYCDGRDMVTRVVAVYYCEEDDTYDLIVTEKTEKGAEQEPRRV